MYFCAIQTYGGLVTCSDTASTVDEGTAADNVSAAVRGEFSWLAVSLSRVNAGLANTSET